jgi:hypothetical protein
MKVKRGRGNLQSGRSDRLRKTKNSVCENSIKKY